VESSPTAVERRVLRLERHPTAPGRGVAAPGRSGQPTAAAPAAPASAQAAAAAAGLEFEVDDALAAPTTRPAEPEPERKAETRIAGPSVPIPSTLPESPSDGAPAPAREPRPVPRVAAPDGARIARIYADRADYEWRRGKLADAAKSVELGLLSDPRSRRLLELRALLRSDPTRDPPAP
jgi:hypothetical protein